MQTEIGTVYRVSFIDGGELDFDKTEGERILNFLHTTEKPNEVIRTTDILNGVTYFTHFSIISIRIITPEVRENSSTWERLFKLESDARRRWDDE